MNNKLFIKRGTRTVGVCAYQDRTDITTVRMAAGIRNVGNGAFCRCASLRDVSLPNSLKMIGEMSFACTNIRSIIIPDNVELIEKRAFAFNPELRSVHIGESVKYIMPGAFSGCEKLEGITISPENDYYYVQNGCLVEKETKKLIVACAPYVVPDGVKIIESQAFMFLLNCDSVTLPASLESINSEGDPIKNFDMCRYVEYDGCGEVTLEKTMIIKAPRNSCAEIFAIENNIRFEEI